MRLELERVLASSEFANSPRLCRFLGFVVERSLAGEVSSLKESIIGIEVFDRDADYNPKTEPVVRTEARRLRSKLADFYEREPQVGTVRISVEKGGYVASFTPIANLFAIEEPTPAPAVPHIVTGAAIAEPKPDRRLVTLPKRITPAKVVEQRPRMLLALATLVIVTVLGSILWRGYQTQHPKGDWSHGPLIRFSLSLDPRQSLVEDWGHNLALSPDGKVLAYVAVQDGVRQLFTRQLSSGETRLFVDSTGAEAPAFSPDGLAVAAVVKDHLRIFRLSGGYQDRAKLPERFSIPGLAWDHDGSIFFNGPPTRDLNKAPSVVFRNAADGATREFVPVDLTITGDQAVMVQEALPGHAGLLISTRSAPPHERSVVLFRNGQTKYLIEDALGGQYVSTGHIVFFRAGNLLTEPYDLRKGEITGPPVEVLTHVGYAGWQGGDIALSATGTLAFVPGSPAMPDRRLIWADMHGRETELPIPPGPYNPLDISPDGKKLLFARFDPVDQNWSLWTYHFSDGASQRVAGPSPDVIVGCWAADGKSVIYGSKQNDEAVGEILRKSEDGTGKETKLASRFAFGHFPQSRSADGRWILYTLGTLPDTKSDIWALDLSGPTPVNRPILRTTAWEQNPAISPDGEWLAYTKEAGDRSDVFVGKFPDCANPILLSPQGGAGPTWSPDGRTIYFWQGRKMMAADFAPPHAGPPRELFEGDYLSPDLWQRRYLITPDGSRFLLAREDAPRKPAQIIVLVNWFDELSRVLKTQH